MVRLKTYQELFKRYRRPGDLVFAAGFFLLALALVANIPAQTTWVPGTTVFAQPAFWPVVALAAMALFSLLYLIGALVSERIPGRAREVLCWLRSLEYVGWFMAYVAAVPWIGYLLGSVLFTGLLTCRAGYRSWRWVGISSLFAVAVVVVFKALLQVKIPAGEIYQLLPPGSLRSFVMIYF